MCAVDDFQRLRFGNSQSPDKLTGKPKTKNQWLHCAPSMRSMAQPDISPDRKTPFLDSYSCHFIFPTHIRPSFLMTNHLPNTSQRHHSPFHSWTGPSTNQSKILWPTHLSQATHTHSLVFPLLVIWASFWSLWRLLQLLTLAIVNRSSPETALILMSWPKDMLTAVVAGRAKPHQLTLANMTVHNQLSPISLP